MSTGPTVQVVQIRKWPQAWLSLSLVMIAAGVVFFALAMANFPLVLVAKAARDALIVHNTPAGIANFSLPPASDVTLHVWNYTSMTGSSITLQQLSYKLSLQTVRYNISFSDSDTLVRYWSRNVWYVTGDAFRSDVVVQPSFVHFYQLATSRTRTIPNVLRQMLNGTQGVPAMTDLTTRCSISSIYYGAFAAQFQIADRIVDFFQGVDRRDAGLAARFQDCGVTADNVPFVAAFLHSLSLIGFAQTHATSAEIARTTPAQIFATFMPNQTTDASAYFRDDYTEKFTGSGSVSDLKRYNRYKGSPVVQSPPWASAEVVQGARDYQGDTFQDEFNLQLNMFSPLTMRTETWRSQGSVQLYGLDLDRFQRVPETFLNAAAVPSNAKYYMYGPSGVFNMNPSTTGAPVHLSQPHFLGGDASLFNSVSGLVPDPDAHASFLDFEPNLGVPLQAQSRFQMNLRLEKGMTADPLLVRGDYAYLPLWWIEIGGAADAATAEQLKASLVGAVQACFGIRLIMSMAALPLFCYGIAILRASIVFISKN